MPHHFTWEDDAMWRMSAVYLARIIGSVHPCLADVIDEYRDPKFTGGYLL